MAKKLKLIPRFQNEGQEREFWESHDTTDYVDWSKAKRMQFPNLKLSPPKPAEPPAKLDRIKRP